ncbi:putative membrane protein [Streptomyces griseochromogenes]|uniref:Cyclase n=1 Tax=Streptomyces griseochromogenes TaxID=68214 RepID=A0A1B1B0Q5_9ACTN|nr:SRPBCC family protein [Streptomyces griseochromogenes]ANP52342.1 cyclase [Streptomyces griseochromogenes]MBP2055763.1 putative membrane protein [Streptomyces griseochromogenes]
MSTLELHVDVGVPIDTAWENLHQVENYPHFVDGVRGARTEAGGRAHLEVDAGGRARDVEAEVSDRGERVMEWLSVGAPELAGSFSLQPLDKNHTRIQARLEYDPGSVRDTFGGPKGFAQTNAIERLVRSDLEHFKEYVERG